MNYGFHHHQELGQTKEVGFKVKGLLTFPTFHFVVCLNTSSSNLSFNQNSTTDTLTHVLTNITLSQATMVSQAWFVVE